MSKEQYPLIKRCFPELWISEFNEFTAIVKAESLERELEKAVRVSGAYYQSGRQSMWATENDKVDAGTDTHTALLIGIEPIVKGCPTCGK